MLYRLRNWMYIFCIIAIQLFNVIVSMYKYTRIRTTDVTDWLLIIGQSPVLICNIMFIWFEPASMTPLICHLWLSESHHQCKMYITANYFSVITLSWFLNWWHFEKSTFCLDFYYLYSMILIFSIYPQLGTSCSDKCKLSLPPLKLLWDQYAKIQQYNTIKAVTETHTRYSGSSKKE